MGDYLYELGPLAELPGAAFSRKRRLANRFRQRCGRGAALLDGSNPRVQAALLDVFDRWAAGRGSRAEESALEYAALRRLLVAADHLPLVAMGAHVGARLVGFTIVELVGGDHASTLFTKADPAEHGLFEYLKQELARHLLARGYRYLNTQQDLGLPGLRQSKLSYRPMALLKKYTISM